MISARQGLRIQNLLLGIIAFVLVLFLLSQGRFILISLVVAIILFSLTSEAIRAIARLQIGPVRVPVWLASVVALMLIAATLLSLAAVLVAQANEVVGMALRYYEPAQTAIADLFGWMGADVEAAVLNSMRTIELPGYLRALAGQASGLLSATVLVILFVGFLFAERIWFATKLQNLMGDAAQAERASKVVETIMHRVNRYLLVKTGVSAVTGGAVYLIFVMFGFDLALPVAVLTFALNYIPSLGSIIATLAAALVVQVQTGDASAALAVLGGVGVLQFAIGNVIDPMLMGHALRLSSFGIIISLAFWGAVWGLPGMFLAVPIMVAVMILCSQTEVLRPVAVLLSREGLPDTGDPDPDA
ncbi:AI-2E family transporter [Phaeovulum veldkampii]|uniref:AI-2E family transporter n=1 Tax=Phaeovulum veldkampii TaxID=33049 RepID=UPI0010CE6A9C|nr:putative PurR-regulated permease PerM [Phaeovulum veldkampii DSM 11550]